MGNNFLASTIEVRSNFLGDSLWSLLSYVHLRRPRSCCYLWTMSRAGRRNYKRLETASCHVETLLYLEGRGTRFGI